VSFFGVYSCTCLRVTEYALNSLDIYARADKQACIQVTEAVQVYFREITRLSAGELSEPLSLLESLNYIRIIVEHSTRSKPKTRIQINPTTKLTKLTKVDKIDRVVRTL